MMKTKARPKTITLERTWKAPIEDVWDLWTTKKGIESWWGPEGFSVKVRTLDLRPGGVLTYAMSAIAPETIDFMKKAGMQVTTEHRATYLEVAPQRLLVYEMPVDFVPGVAAYDVATRLELHPIAEGVRMVLILDAMHDDVWTQRAVMGHESELRKLEKVLASGLRKK